MRFTFLILLTLIIACGPEESGEHNVFIYNQPNPITSLDPAFAKAQNNIWAVNHMYNGLVALDDSLNIIPSIASSWSVKEGKELTFYIKENIFFHDNPCFNSGKGRQVNAFDVQYSLNRLIDPKVNSPGSWLFTDKIGHLPIFEVIDSMTFRINLKAPFMPILGILTMPYCCVIPQECDTYYGENFRSNPVGTGPYQFKRWVEDQGLFLKKNEDYKLENPPAVDYVKTEFISDKQIAFYELVSGEIDFISGLESSYINEALDKNGKLNPSVQEKLQFTKAPYLNMEYLGINMEMASDHPMLSKVNFRKALNYAIDKELMMMSLRNGVGEPANAGFIPAGLPSHDPNLVKGYEYNLDKAKELLITCNYKGEEIVLSTNNEYLDICTFVASQWEAIGINCSIDVKESAVLRDGMRKSNVELFRASWIADYPDGESFLCMFYSKNPAPPNYTRFSNERFDELYEESLITEDTDKRINLYQEMDRIIIDEAPVIFLFYDESAVFYSKDIQGYSNNGLNLLNINFEKSGLR